MSAALSAPQPIASSHELASFDCGVTSLNEWLKRRTRSNQANDASRTFVVCNGCNVVAYYALASGGVTASAAFGRFRRNMPNPIPVVVLGRLAVDQSWRGQGLGRAMFRDAAQRIIYAADAIGVRGVIVHAISEQAKMFHLALGFEPSPLDPLTLMVTLADLRATME
jgi:predicted N-acetyltransferase YhbS